MNWDSLITAMLDALATGRVGVPVGMRVCLGVPGGEQELQRAAWTALRLASVAFECEPGSLAGQEHRSGQQLNLLVEFERGQTFSATVFAAPRSVGTDFVLWGNHGTIQLVDSHTTLHMSPAANESPPQAWVDALRTAITSKTVVSVMR